MEGREEGEYERRGTSDGIPSSSSLKAGLAASILVVSLCDVDECIRMGGKGLIEEGIEESERCFSCG